MIYFCDPLCALHSGSLVSLVFNTDGLMVYVVGVGTVYHMTCPTSSRLFSSHWFRGYQGVLAAIKVHVIPLAAHGSESSGIWGAIKYDFVKNDCKS